MDMFIKCYMPIYEGKKSRVALLTLKVARDRSESVWKTAKKKVQELEAELKKVKDESEKALRDTKISEEAAVKVIQDFLEIKQQLLERSEAAFIEANGVRKKLENKVTELKGRAKTAKAAAGESLKKIEEEKDASFEEGILSFLYTT